MDFESFAKKEDLELLKWVHPSHGYPYCDSDTNRALRAFSAGKETLDEVIPKIKGLISDQIVIGNMVNFETIRKAIEQLKNT